MRHLEERDENGMTLIEVILALVILGAVVSALMSALVTTSTASRSHRDLATADAALRDYAEAYKAAVRATCVGGATTYTVSFTAPSGFTPSPAPGTSQSCPAGVTSIKTVTVSIALPNGTTTKTLSIAVRSP